MKNQNNILILLGLDENKALTYILPILRTKKVKNMYIVRDCPLLNEEKQVKNINPPKIIQDRPILKSIYKFLQLIILNLRNKFDIIYSIHMFPHGIFGWLVSKLFKINYIFSSIANDSELYYWGHFLTPLTKRIFLDAYYIIVTGLLKHIERKDELPRFLKEINTPPQKILPGYTSVFTEKFSSENKEKRWDIITVGRLYHVKRIDLFIKIIKILSEELDFDLNCAIIGDGPLLQDLKEKILKLGLQKSISFLGHIPNNELNNYYNRTKIFLLTSENEGFPATLIEAMLTKNCVISSSVGAIPNLIKNGINGFLYSNINEAVKIISKCLKNQDLRKEIGSNARKSALEVSAGNRRLIWNKLL